MPLLLVRGFPNSIFEQGKTFANKKVRIKLNELISIRDMTNMKVVAV